MLSRRILAMLIAVVLPCVAAGPSVVRADVANPTKLTLVAGPVAGTGYIGMGAVGKEINNLDPQLTITLLPGSDMSNPIRLQNNEVEIAAETIALGVAAHKGVAPFKKPVTNVASIANLRTSARMNIVVRADSGITSIEQIRERKIPLRLAHGPRGSASEVVGRWVLGEYGIDFKDITKWGGKLYANNFDDVANMLKDGQVDMLFWGGPGEAWFLTEMATSTELRWLPVSDEVVARLGEKYLMTPARFEKGLYRGMIREDIQSAGTAAEIMVRANMSDDLVYKITKALCEGRDSIAMANPTWDTFIPEKAFEGISYPLHPGAAKYYRERGWMN